MQLWSTHSALLPQTCTLEVDESTSIVFREVERKSYQNALLSYCDPKLRTRVVCDVGVSAMLDQYKIGEITVGHLQYSCQTTK